VLCTGGVPEGRWCMLGGGCDCLAAPPGLLRMLPILDVLIRNLEFCRSKRRWTSM